MGVLPPRRPCFQRLKIEMPINTGNAVAEVAKSRDGIAQTMPAQTTARMAKINNSFRPGR